MTVKERVCRCNWGECDCFKDDLINMIIGGTHIPLGGISKTLTPFCGNQWNEDWKWNRDELGKLLEEELKILYDKYRRRTNR